MKSTIIIKTAAIKKELEKQGIAPETATFDQVITADKAIMKRLRKFTREL